MKKYRLLTIWSTLLLVLVLGCTDSPENDPPAARTIPTLEAGDRVQVTLIQTTDMHHRAAGSGASATYSPGDSLDNSGLPGSAGNTDLTEGGYARLSHKIGQIRLQKDRPDQGSAVLLVDSGDFLMGTVYDLTAASPAAFQFFQQMQYDVITLGNHEFDWSPAGLALLLQNARTSQNFSVPIVATNMITDGVAGTTDDGLEALQAAGAICTTRLITLANGVRIGVIGLLGPTADFYAPAAPPVTFDHTAAVIQNQVDDLRNSQGAHLIVALSHSGILEPGGTPSGDDIALAGAVSGIDIIASGHEHQQTDSVVTVGNTRIICAGHYGKNLAQLDIDLTVGTGVTAVQLTNHAINDSIPGDPSMNYLVDSYDRELNAALGALSPGLTVNRVLAGTDSGNLAIPQMAAESGMANLVADSLRGTLRGYVAAGLVTGPTIGVIANGNIRNGFDPGQSISFADIYSVLPLGMTLDPTQQDLPGYPLMLVYLNGDSVWNLCQFISYVIASQDSNFMGFLAAGSPQQQALYGALSNLNPEYYLGLSGIQFTHGGLPGGYQVIAVNGYAPTDGQCRNTPTVIDRSDAATLYPCVLDLYILLLMQSDAMQMLMTGLGIPVIPVNADGTVPVTVDNLLDFRLDGDPAAGIQEVKEWQALLDYLTAPAAAGGLESFIADSVYGSAALGSGDTSRVNP
ncbi:MAG: bifunctional metallophosphatase/5'-nucleotidase [Thermodesulfobacteriota bacterium]